MKLTYAAPLSIFLEFENELVADGSEETQVAILVLVKPFL